MGMLASACLWYGVYGEPTGAAYEKVVEDEHSVDGTHITVIWEYDRAVGIGGCLVYEWAGDKPKPIDLTDTGSLVDAVNKFLDEYDVPGERAFYLSANNS